ncbi:OLC1v1029390C1 [Oldenlandia corymbosa var. corymbosa]|uniref:OLC1v1029390C1 n=1 Tax=Oldenlandia corymbosa var. corymbosa TaxID=529605 RepID=A0AAV1CFU6_OLDCO|nr:OLC1v1029390C1 [Oldenlandia corymbosa var. corymbosa]
MISSPVDRFYSLPELAIVKILSSLSTKDAVKTSLLSKRWKSLWINVPTFDFELPGPEAEGNRKTASVQFVNNVFLHNVVKYLAKFRLLWSPGESEVAYVNMWVRHAIIHRNVRNLTLQIGTGCVCEVPAELLTSGTLESLHLCGLFVLKVSGREVCFPKLNTLKLFGVKYELAESLHRLIFGCPVLLNLVLDCIREDNITVYKISSLSLRSLIAFFSNCWPDLEVDAPALEISLKSTYPKGKAILCYTKDGKSGICPGIAGVVQLHNQAKSLTLKGTAGDALSYAVDRLVKSSSRFEKLRDLDIQLHCCKWSCLTVLLERSIVLQVLKISMDGECDEDTHQLSWKDPTQVPECLSSSLSKFSFQGLVGREDEVAMIRYILKHGAVLKSVELVSWPPAISMTSGTDLEFKFQMLQKISMFPRGSDDCELSFILLDDIFMATPS